VGPRRRGYTLHAFDIAVAVSSAYADLAVARGPVDNGSVVEIGITTRSA
jgi:hypothetical protein